MPRLLDEVAHHLRLRNLAAQLDDAVRYVDVDLPLRYVGGPEEQGLELLRQRRVSRVQAIGGSSVRQPSRIAAAASADHPRRARASPNGRAESAADAIARVGA